ncbi:MAG: proline--tRNA ligase [Candidatus Hodarchaeales archaeon]|jgi:prolyl-tRNA synthetase
MPLENSKDNFSDWFDEIIRKAEISDNRFPVKGFNVLMPVGWEIWERIRESLNEKFYATGHKNAYFPLVIPEEFLEKESEHFSGFIPEVAWVTHRGDTPLPRKLALRPTSETVMYPMYAIWIRSHADLPLKLSNWSNIIRMDTKNTKPLLRDREFLWNEAHTCHVTAEECEGQVRESMDIYSAILDELCLSYLILRRPPQDTFPGAVYSIAFDSPLPDGRSLQSGTTHNLGQNFAKAFDIKFLDADGETKHVYQTCYGLSTRLIAAIVAVHGDDQGLIIPPRLAPTQIVIIPIYTKKERENVNQKAQEILATLSEQFRVVLDDRDQYTPGWKFNEHEMRGVPLRLEIGPRDIVQNQGVLVRRDTGEKTAVPLAELLAQCQAMLDDISATLLKRAQQLLEESLRDAESLAHLDEIFEVFQGFARVNWCGSDACNETIKNYSGGEIRGAKHGETEEPFGPCIVCGKVEVEVVYVSQAY